MNWALAVALAWVVLLLPAGYLIGVSMRRAKRRTTVQARQRVWRRARMGSSTYRRLEHRRPSEVGPGIPERGAAASPGEEPLRRRGA